ncbi:MAG: UDP-N-acetylmuramoyl-L-alanyl-D-glutamate--2,6-diaminopimelate ligase [Lachnospiraceae bacterium]
MNNLKKLLERLDFEHLSGSLDVEITNINYDSRCVEKDALFVCIRGTIVDGHTFAKEVANKGAAVLVVEENVDVPSNITVIKVKDTRLALAMLSAAYFDYPADTLKVIGVTGTKGKTTTTHMVRSILEQAGYQTGLIGTIEVRYRDNVIPAEHTTPESYLVQKYFREMLDSGCDSCVMEVSSQGLMMHRTAGFVFEIGIFTNIEPDHIGPREHASFEEYMECKSLLFRQCRLGILNADDPHIQDILKGHTCLVETFGFHESASLRADELHLLREPGILGVRYHVTGSLDFHVEIHVPGRFSVYNSLTAIAICKHFNVSTDVMKSALKNAVTKGRIELIPISDSYTLMIDYAHNAMSLNSLLVTLKEYEPKRLVCMFGCGGNRSRYRRFEMGEVSGNLADLTVITSDNPRDEDPQAIIDDIRTGIQKTSGAYEEIIDRKDAIRYCIRNAKEGDIIVLAGKGHEDYQEIKGVKYPMDERVLIAEILSEQEFKSNSL